MSRWFRPIFVAPRLASPRLASPNRQALSDLGCGCQRRGAMRVIFIFIFIFISRPSLIHFLFISSPYSSSVPQACRRSARSMASVARGYRHHPGSCCGSSDHGPSLFHLVLGRLSPLTGMPNYGVGYIYEMMAGKSMGLFCLSDRTYPVCGSKGTCRHDRLAQLTPVGQSAPLQPLPRRPNGSVCALNFGFAFSLSSLPVLTVIAFVPPPASPCTGL